MAGGFRAMSSELDPHHLVALMSHVFANIQDGSSRCMDPSSLNFKHSIVDNHATNVRTFPILDAIANISVSQEKRQVIAVALQMDSKNKQIRLTIADNYRVAEPLLTHLHNVWRNLQTLSNEYTKQRVSDKPEYQLKSPEMPMRVALALKVQIFRDIYLYSLEKQMWQIKKRLQNLGHFMKVLLDRRGSLDLRGFEENLFNAVHALMTALGLVSKLHNNQQSQLTDEEWTEVYAQSATANEEVRVVLAGGEGTGCEVLAEELKDDCPRGLFDLRRALVKLTSLSQHIESLFGFAHSPRLRPALLYRMFIIGVPNQNRKVQLPSSPEEWTLFLETACQQRYDWQVGDSVELSNKFGRRKYMCAVHCECKLIRHLETTRKHQWGNVPPFSYIGVSKLSCSACRIWIAAFNELGRRQYYTRGSHGKWYWPWGMPRMGESLDRIMAKKVLEEYIAHETARDRLKSQSDSDGASPRGALHRLDDELREGVVAKRSAAVQKFGGDRRLLIDSQILDFWE